ncbi:MAG: hypothetical protein J5605_04670, partial [Bacteroidales bacterium]|nr:hypothetical protein [Bacteroidales bacterium]
MIAYRKYIILWVAFLISCATLAQEPPVRFSAGTSGQAMAVQECINGEYHTQGAKPVLAVAAGSRYFYCASGIATLVVTATAEDPLLYAWQISKDAGASWQYIMPGMSHPNFSGEKDSVLHIANLTDEHLSYQYRCIAFTSCDGLVSDTSEVITLTCAAARFSFGFGEEMAVEEFNNATFNAGVKPTIITEQPVASNYYCEAGRATLTVGVNNALEHLSYRWQYSVDGSTWNNILKETERPSFTGFLTKELHINDLTEDEVNYKYRCIVEEGCTGLLVDTTNAITLTCMSARFDGGLGENCTAWYTQGGFTETQSSEYIIDQTLESTYFCENGTAELHISINPEVYSSALYYTWEYSTDGGWDWHVISSEMHNPHFEHVTDSALQISELNESCLDFQYRCIVLGNCGVLLDTSEAIVLNCTSARYGGDVFGSFTASLDITGAPITPIAVGDIIESQTTTHMYNCDAGTADLNVTIDEDYLAAVGEVSYIWEYSTDGGSSWKIIYEQGIKPQFSGFVTPTLHVSALDNATLDYKYRCRIISDCRHEEVLSDEIVLTCNSSRFLAERGEEFAHRASVENTNVSLAPPVIT